MKILIVSDIHGNLPALHEIEKAAGTVDKIIFLGDVLDYGPQPIECMHWLTERKARKLLGNHDNAVINRVGCNCGAAFRPLSEATREFMWSILGEDDYRFFDRLEPSAAHVIDGIKIFAAHASPADPLFKYVKPSMPDEDVAAEIEGLDAEVVMLGHTHFQMDRLINGVRVINPGSAGQPRDGDPRAGFAIWNDGDISFHRIEYPVEKTVAELAKCPLEKDVIEFLTRVLKTGS